MNRILYATKIWSYESSVYTAHTTEHTHSVYILNRTSYGKKITSTTVSWYTPTQSARTYTIHMYTYTDAFVSCHSEQQQKNNIDRTLCACTTMSQMFWKAELCAFHKEEHMNGTLSMNDERVLFMFCDELQGGEKNGNKLTAKYVAERKYSGMTLSHLSICSRFRLRCFSFHSITMLFDLLIKRNNKMPAWNWVPFSHSAEIVFDFLIHCSLYLPNKFPLFISMD